jgi:hypothetical protein
MSASLQLIAESLNETDDDDPIAQLASGTCFTMVNESDIPYELSKFRECQKDIENVLSILKNLEEKCKQSSRLIEESLVKNGAAVDIPTVDRLSLRDAGTELNTRALQVSRLLEALSNAAPRKSEAQQNEAAPTEEDQATEPRNEDLGYDTATDPVQERAEMPSNRRGRLFKSLRLP